MIFLSWRIFFGINVETFHFYIRVVQVAYTEGDEKSEERPEEIENSFNQHMVHMSLNISQLANKQFLICLVKLDLNSNFEFIYALQTPMAQIEIGQGKALPEMSCPGPKLKA